ncbi:hypothetical protein AAE478_002819 [Parahypoxylon ruwenzoriense]
MAPSRKKRQTRLTFEPAASSDSPYPTSSPAKVRFDNSAGGSSQAISSPSNLSKRTARTSGGARKKQSKLQTATAYECKGSSQTAASPELPPTASFMPKIRGSTQLPASDDSSDSATEVGDVINFDDHNEDDDDDEPIAPPSSLRRRAAAIKIADESDEDEDEDEDDEPIVTPSSLKRSRPIMIELDDSEDDFSPAKIRKTSQTTPGRLRRPGPASSSPAKRAAHRVHRTEKQKKMELLRRRRAGEKIAELTPSETSSDGDKRGIYDSDSEGELQVLKEFDDEELEPEEDQGSTHPSRGKDKEPARKRKKSPEGQGDDDNDDDLEDFVTDDDDDATIGAPANLDIPLQFTAQAHKPLKDQFPHVVQWLVHNRINPAFERNDPVYSNAWRKLDDEVRGLASSKFASAAWKPEFHRALKGRPKMESYEMDRGGGEIYNTCEACGRSGHPATFKIIFSGHPYYKNTIADVESESEESDENDGNDSGHESVDTQGMPLAPTTKEWCVGAVCCSNAETAHSLIHWKHALKEWVEERLEENGWMRAHKLKERERMKARKRRDLANSIADDWREKGIIANLYRDFKNTLENARNKSTTTGRGRGRFL